MSSLPPARTGQYSPPKFHVSRRSFLRHCGAVAALTGLPAWFLERELAAAETSSRPAPVGRPGIALIGCGGQGRRDAANAASFGDVVAVCDVDDDRLASAVKQFANEEKKPVGYTDFRRVLEQRDVHVVINGTPDHWHTLINIAAARAGKDVYAEKPLTLTIDEGRHVVAAVRKAGIILQTGTQQRSSQRFRLACELVRNGRIGKLQEANVWLPAGLREGPFKSEPVPAYLNWDYWLGQAPQVEYVPQRCRGRFRFWYDYSGGTMTDWGAHHNDIAYWAIGLIAPRDIEAEALVEPIPGGYTAHSEYKVRYRYENGVRLNIATTTDENPSGAKTKPDGQRNGIRFVGTEGWIWVNREQLTASEPEILKAPLAANAVRLYQSSNHMENFFDCVQSRKPPICDAETGHRSATMCHLGSIALRTGLKLTWDAQRERFTGEHATVANRHVAREMRKPYGLGFAG
ncbi:MAG: Gfo/Idh/MocA family oxidoreductase [Opitutaceae bacterium]|nr:Gfo/Idh/MocA family oxidoreductase [Opitutaceae bacterium]